MMGFDVGGPLVGISLPEILILMFLFVVNVLPAIAVFFVARRLEFETWVGAIFLLASLFIPTLGITISLFVMAFAKPNSEPATLQTPITPTQNGSQSDV